MGKGKQMLRRAKNDILKRCLWRNYAGSPVSSVQNNALFSEYASSIVKGAAYSVLEFPLPEVSAKHKWVGGQWFGGTYYAIPNDMTQALTFDGTTTQLIGDVPDALFKWTGGCVWNGCIYGFPRTASSFFQVDLTTQICRELPLEIRYAAEHHYGGVVTAQGVVYQPPRNTDHILATDLTSGKSWKIQIAPKYWNMKLRYCGSILHPNGFIYFLPEAENKVIRFDPKSEKIELIGAVISPMVFDAKVWIDGNIYGFSAYKPGILKIDVKHNTTEMIHTEIMPGAYGTKLGINGRLYSVPGDGSEVLEFDLERDQIRSIYRFEGEKKAKYAGGATNLDGMIGLSPATSNTFAYLRADCAGTEIPSRVFQQFFRDFY